MAHIKGDWQLNEAITPQWLNGVDNFETYKIGDTLTTVRTDLPDNWLLCDGSGFSGTEYPKLAEMIAAGTPSGQWEQNNQGVSDLHCIEYGDGWWVAIGDNGTVYTKQGSPSGEWTKNNTAFGNVYFRQVAYGNGYWVALGTSNCWYKSGDPSGTWTKHPIMSAVSSITALTFGNGSFVIGAGAYNSNPAIYHTTNPSATWQQASVTSPAYGTSFIGISYSNGRWVAFGSVGMPSSKGIYYYTSDLTSPFVPIQCNNTNSVYGLVYFEGFWVFTCGSNSFYLTALGESPILISGLSGKPVAKVVVGNGYLVTIYVSPVGAVYYMLGSPDTGTVISNFQGNKGIQGIAYGNGQFVIVGNGGTVYYTNSYTLPTISTGAYTYIKAKEEIS